MELSPSKTEPNTFSSPWSHHHKARGCTTPHGSSGREDNHRLVVCTTQAFSTNNHPTHTHKRNTLQQKHATTASLLHDSKGDNLKSSKEAKMTLWLVKTSPNCSTICSRLLPGAFYAEGQILWNSHGIHLKIAKSPSLVLVFKGSFHTKSQSERFAPK